MRRHVLDTPVSYYAIYLAARYLPVPVCHALGRAVAMIVYTFSTGDRRGFAYNLSRALGPNGGHRKIRTLTRRMFLNYGRYMVDYFLLPQLPPSEVRRFFGDLRGEHHLKEALDRGRGAILLSAHVGNWEFGGTMMRLEDYPLAVVAMSHNTRVTNGLVNRLRKGKGIEVIEVDRSPFSSLKILKHLRRNGVVAMIGDRDFLGTGKAVTFFGETVYFPVGPVLLAMKSGAALIPAFVLQGNKGRYFGVLEAPIDLCHEGDRATVLRKNLRKTARVFERTIRAYPDQWYCPRPITERALP
ncbi:MAG: lysophospholipid acyltransferase family protein [Deltaproteobacteria bacterium]|nr:lysophospholipid acyltransferase family protein [Deltaproteobacteria bacterium]MBW1924823.1 lysophospholipid acyltransferase family protein [Deltaproteobacteria bacterium]MBW1948504.1 lysophospholipid acyltransferase family protein [Deltaproteobacteria bacterium]MBW2006669.1 lysophospholipid acyltransferase family protein [Deltaproteobacteria bacterium]MBW2101207.1 lysophospholipid acyltransferase family protein [Deltaproteobacteria bacterium]